MLWKIFSSLQSHLPIFSAWIRIIVIRPGYLIRWPAKSVPNSHSHEIYSCFVIIIPRPISGLNVALLTFILAREGIVEVASWYFTDNGCLAIKKIPAQSPSCHTRILPDKTPRGATRIRKYENMAINLSVRYLPQVRLFKILRKSSFTTLPAITSKELMIERRKSLISL